MVCGKTRLGGFFGVGFVVIEDDDSGPRARAGVGVAAEGAGGTSTLEIPITLSEPSTETVRVTWETGSNTATASLDFVGSSGVVELAPGETTATVSVEVIDDAVPEADEIVVLILRSAEHATVGGWLGIGAGTIVDDD